MESLHASKTESQHDVAGASAVPADEPAATDIVKHSRRPLRALWRWIRDFFPNLRDAGFRWNEDDAGSLAASVAYYLALSLFPMMLLLTSGIGLFLQFSHLGKDAEQQILEAVETYASPMVKEHIEQVLKQLRNHSLVSGPFGILAAILAAIGVFAQIDRGFDRIFRVPPSKNANLSRTIYRVLHHRFSAFMMLVCLGGLIVVLFAASMLLAQVRSLLGKSVPSMVHVFGPFEMIFAILANAMLFTLVYRTLPKRRVLWRDALRGGLLAAFIWELGREILGVFLIGMRYTTAYGAIGSFIALLLWCYYGISIIFFGAEYLQVLEARRASKRGAAIGASSEVNPPKLEASASIALTTDSSCDEERYDSGKRWASDGDGREPTLLETVNVERQRPRRSGE